MAESLGTAAVMSALTRTAVGQFTLATAHLPDTLNRANLDERMLPPAEAVVELPRIELTEAELAAVRSGGTIARGPLETVAEAAAVDPSGRLVAVLTEARQGGLRPLKNFASHG